MSKSMHTRLRLSAVSFASSFVCALGALPAASFAATPITITSKAATDGPIRYTVKVTSKQFGNSQETRTIRSGESDDFTWKTVRPGARGQRMSELRVVTYRCEWRDDPPDADPLRPGRRERRHRDRAAAFPGADAERYEGCDERRQVDQMSELHGGE